MWTDFQKTPPATANEYIQQLQTAKLLGRATSLVIAGVKVDYDSRLPENSENMSLVIRELQEYCWQISNNDWDWTADINPRSQRVGVTEQRYR